MKLFFFQKDFEFLTPIINLKKKLIKPGFISFSGDKSKNCGPGVAARAPSFRHALLLLNKKAGKELDGVCTERPIGNDEYFSGISIREFSLF